MSINTDRLKQVEPSLKRPQHPNQPQTPPERSYEAYRTQNGDAMTSAIAVRAQDATSSLRTLDQRLSQFEDRFADAAVERIDSVALRIEQKIAQRLNARQESRQKPQIVDVLDAFTVPEFDMPPAIAPFTTMGCLPI